MHVSLRLSGRGPRQCVCVCVYIYTHTCMNACIHCMNTCRYMYVCNCNDFALVNEGEALQVHMFASTHVYVYMYTYIYTCMQAYWGFSDGFALAGQGGRVTPNRQ